MTAVSTLRGACMLSCAAVDRLLIDRLGSALQSSPVDGLVSAYLFGSRAADRAHRESDLDVGVLFDRTRYPTRALRFDARVMLAAYLVGALQTRDVDIVGLDDAPPTLVRTVMLDGLQVFCANRAADHAARRNALLRAADLDPFLRRMRRIKLAAIAR